MAFTFKPMTYLVSFTLFVLTFMALGGYVGYGKLRDHFLVQSYLDALPLNAQVQTDAQGQVLCWDERVLVEEGGLSARITASSRFTPVAIQYSDEPGPGARHLSGTRDIQLGPAERTEELRIDSSRRYLYARVFAGKDLKEKGATWLYRYDLRNRQVVRRTDVNPILLPAPFRP